MQCIVNKIEQLFLKFVFLNNNPIFDVTVKTIVCTKFIDNKLLDLFLM
jgi:hypothetical protein